jgi:dTMP kinase
MNAEERYEEVLLALDELRDLSQRMPVVVEGERDVAALRALGIGGSILPLHSGVSVFRVCERIASDHTEAVILTDWDRRGGQLARLLAEGLEANGVRHNTDVRARLARLCKKDVKDVEGLHRFVDNLRPRASDGRRRIRPARRWYAEHNRSPSRRR